MTHMITWAGENVGKVHVKVCFMYLRWQRRIQTKGKRDIKTQTAQRKVMVNNEIQSNCCQKCWLGDLIYLQK